MPTAQSRKKCRRDSRSRGSVGAMGSLPRNELIEIQKHASNARPSRQYGCVARIGALFQFLAQQFSQAPLLLFRWRPSHAEAEHAAKAIRITALTLAQHAVGEGLGELKIHLVIEQRQRLQRRV